MRKIIYIILFLFLIYIIITESGRRTEYLNVINCGEYDNYNLKKSNYALYIMINNIKIMNNNNINNSIKYINKLFDKFKSKGTSESLKVLDNLRKTFLFALICNKYKVYINEENILTYNNFYGLKVKEIKKFISFDEYDVNVFEYQHGLRFANAKIRKYIKDKTILDIGAFHGDSIYILRNYTNKPIYSYEVTQKNIEKLKYYLKKNNVNDNSYYIFKKGITNHVGSMNIQDKSGQDINLNKKGDNNIELTTIDNEVRIHDLKVGFIKIDVEGEAFNVIRGAFNTILTQKPVLSVAIYHNLDEFINIKPFLENNFPDYIFEFQIHNSCKWICEINIISYPNIMSQ